MAKNEFKDKKSIDAGIKRLSGVTANTNNLIQDLGVAIIRQTKDHGDCSQALTLVLALPNSFRREYLVNWFAYYGNIGMNVKQNKVRIIDSKSNRFRKIDVDGANANPWYNPDSVPGQQREQLPNTLMEFSQNIVRFADRLEKQLDAKYPNTDTPMYELTATQEEAAKAAIDVIRNLGNRNMAGMKAAALRMEADKLEAEAEALAA